MRDADLDAVLLIAAFEEADVEGELLPLANRRRASQQAREALEPGGSRESGGSGGAAPGRAASESPQAQEALLVERARALLPELQARVPLVSRVLAASRLGGWVTPLTLVGALLLGLSTNALGPHQLVNVLSQPLLLLLTWNLAVYVWLAVASWRAGGVPREILVGGPVVQGTARVELGAGVGGGSVAGGGASSRLQVSARPDSTLTRLAHGWLARLGGRQAAARIGRQGTVATALLKFSAAAGRARALLLAARLRRLLHLGSALLVLGTVAGMYVRGLLLLYRATWESTFLHAPQVQALLDVVLWPAAAVLGVSVPDVAPLERPATGDAALWIHLHALDALLLVLLPRALLALAETRRIRRLQRALRLDLEAPAFRRHLLAVRGQGSRIDVLAYGLQLPPRTRDALVELLHDALGARAEVRVPESLTYGAEVSELPALDAEAARLVLFPLAQSPEAEVHGRFLGELLARQPAGRPLVVLVDEGDYAERVGDGARRRDERRRAWERVLAEAGVPLVHAALERPADAGTVEALLAALRAGGARTLAPAPEARAAAR